MRIRPALVTGAGSVVALAAVATVVFATTPAEAGSGIVRLLWLALFLGAWGLWATVLLLARQSMAIAVWAGLAPAVTTIALLAALQKGMLSQQLLVGTILATLGISVFIWWRLRRGHTHD
jgi:hypothetical protein